MNAYAIVIFLIICIANLTLSKKTGWMCPHNLFVWFNAVMGIGILAQLDFSRADDMSHGEIILLTAFVYLIASTVFSRYFGLRRLFKGYCNNVSIAYSKMDLQISFALYVVSLAASVMYFYLVGYNVLLYIMMHGVSSGNVTDMRLASYSGANYYAPGYFNQFKNILLPLSYVGLIATYGKISTSKLIYRVMVILLLIPVIFCLLGTGQRAFFVGFIISSVLFLGFVLQGKLKIGRAKLIIVAVGFFAIFSAMSIALGRSGGSSLTSDIEELLSRIFFEQQYGSVYGFRYIYRLPVQYGADWGTDLLSVLPGLHGTHLSNIISGILYGSDRGTVPVSLWTSVYYNWGWVGVMVFPVMLALTYTGTTRYMLNRSRVAYLRLMTFSFLSFILASWVSAGPMQLLNNGLATVLILLAILKVIDSSSFFKKKYQIGIP